MTGSVALLSKKVFEVADKLPPYRHPSVMAQIAATSANFCPGKIGSGNNAALMHFYNCSARGLNSSVVETFPFNAMAAKSAEVASRSLSLALTHSLAAPL